MPDECPHCKMPHMCQKCKIPLKKGDAYIDEDGSAIQEFVCEKCKGRFADVKIPNRIFFGQQNTGT